MAQFTVDGIVYPFPEIIRLGDATLIREVTGIDVDELADAAATTKIIAYAAVSIWQANPAWSRSKVVKYVEKLDLSALAVEGDDDDPPEIRAAPPASPASTSDSTNGRAPLPDEARV
jgi:hypothetical protein